MKRTVSALVLVGVLVAPSAARAQAPEPTTTGEAKSRTVVGLGLAAISVTGVVFGIQNTSDLVAGSVSTDTGSLGLFFGAATLASSIGVIAAGSPGHDTVALLGSIAALGAWEVGVATASLIGATWSPPGAIESVALAPVIVPDHTGLALAARW